MKLKDIINYDLSYWNVLGKSGGTALPDNDKSTNVDGVDIWKKSPPFRQKGKRIQEASSGTGTGLGGSGATQPPTSGPAELEYDLDYVEDEFKGKDTRAEIKTNKKKRESLKQYLLKRTGHEIDRNSKQ